MISAAEHPLVRVFARSRDDARAHQDLLAWRAGLPMRVGIAWIPLEWVRSAAAAEYGWLPAEVRIGLASDDRQAAGRAARRAGDLVALAAAMVDLAPACDVSEAWLYHTPLGQPCVSLTGEARALWPHGLHVSFSHDGAAHVAVVGAARGLVGLGVDILHLGRLERPDRGVDHIRRLARRVMGAAEHAAFASAAAADGPAEFTRRAAVHFSLMEAGSKALGTGLRLGMGIGRAGSLPPTAIGASPVDGPIRFIMEEPAERRLQALGGAPGGRLEGHWAADSEHIMTFAAAWSNEVAR